MKPKRIENRRLLDTYHTKPCLACGLRPSDPAHVRTVARGGPDLPWNIMPLCRRHHTEQHKIGWDSMMRKYPKLYSEMTAAGWVKLGGKLWNPGLGAPNETEEV